MSQNDPAFPRIVGGSAHEGRISGSYDLRFESAGGMSLRDYFAAQALIAVHLFESTTRLVTMRETGCDPDDFDDASSAADLARCAYNLADELLKARDVERGRPAAPPEAE